MGTPVKPSTQGKPATVDWNPEPTKELMKSAYGTCLSAIGTAIKAPIKVFTQKKYGASVVNDSAVEIGVDKAISAAKRGTDALANCCYKSQTSLGSRVARKLGCKG